MVEEVLQAGRDAVVVLAADDRERIDLAVEPSQRFEDGRSAAPLIFLVHAVEQRQVQFGGVDDLRRVPAPAQRRFEETYHPDAGARFARRAVKNRDVQRHGRAPGSAEINLTTGDRTGVVSQAGKAAADFVRLPQCACAVPTARVQLASARMIRPSVGRCLNRETMIESSPRLRPEWWSAKLSISSSRKKYVNGHS